MAENPDANKRRLTHEEAVELLSRPSVGVFSSLSRGGWIHSVPVHFIYSDGEFRFLAGSRDTKTRNVERTGHGTLCVEETSGSARSYVSVSGPATVDRPPRLADLRTLDAKYARSDFTDGWDDQSLASAVVITVVPDRWIAWTDWD